MNQQVGQQANIKSGIQNPNSNHLSNQQANPQTAKEIHFSYKSITSKDQSKLMNQERHVSLNRPQIVTSGNTSSTIPPTIDINMETMLVSKTAKTQMNRNQQKTQEMQQNGGRPLGNLEQMEGHAKVWRKNEFTQKQVNQIQVARGQNQQGAHIGMNAGMTKFKASNGVPSKSGVMHDRRVSEKNQEMLIMAATAETNQGAEDQNSRRKQLKPGSSNFRQQQANTRQKQYTKQDVLTKSQPHGPHNTQLQKAQNNLNSSLESREPNPGFFINSYGQNASNDFVGQNLGQNKYYQQRTSSQVKQPTQNSIRQPVEQLELIKSPHSCHVQQQPLLQGIHNEYPMNTISRQQKLQQSHQAHQILQIQQLQQHMQAKGAGLNMNMMPKVTVSGNRQIRAEISSPVFVESNGPNGSSNNTINNTIAHNSQIRIVSAKQVNQSQKMKSRKIHDISTANMPGQRVAELEQANIASIKAKERGKSESINCDLQPPIKIPQNQEKTQPKVDQQQLRTGNPSSIQPKYKESTLANQQANVAQVGQSQQLHLPLIQTPKSQKQKLNIHEVQTVKDTLNDFAMAMKAGGQQPQTNLVIKNAQVNQNQSFQQNGLLIAGSNRNEVLASVANGSKGKILQHLDKIQPKHPVHQTSSVVGPDSLSKSNSIIQSQKQLKRGDKSMPPSLNSKVGNATGGASQQNPTRLPNHHHQAFVPQSRAETQSLQSLDKYNQQQQITALMKQPIISMNNNGNVAVRHVDNNYQMISDGGKSLMNMNLNSQYQSQTSTGTEFQNQSRGTNQTMNPHFVRYQFWFDEVNMSSGGGPVMPLTQFPSSAEYDDQIRQGQLSQISQSQNNSKQNSLQKQQTRGGSFRRGQREKKNMNVITKGLTNMEEQMNHHHQNLLQMQSGKKTKTPGLNYNQKLELNEQYQDPESPEQENDQFRFNNQPLLLGDYNGGDDDEPEEEDSQQQASNDDQSSLSDENGGGDFDESGESDDMAHLPQDDQYTDTYSPEAFKDQEDFIQDDLNIHIQDNEDSTKQSTMVTQASNTDHARFMNSLGSSQQSNVIDNASMGSVLALRRVKTSAVRRKKSRKARRGDKYGAGSIGDCSKINEVNESGDEENPEPIEKIALNQDQLPSQMDGDDKIHPSLENEFGLSQDLSFPTVSGQALNKKQLFLLKPPNKTIILNYGPIPGRPPTIFFSYPAFLKLQRPYKKDRIQLIQQEQLHPYSQLTFRISSHTHTYNCVVNALKTAGFHLVTSGYGPTSWNCLWTGLIKPNKLKGMNPYQKLNHFAGAWGIGSKANLWRNVQRQRRKRGKEYEICPPTYIFPDDYKRWCNEREMNNFRDMYILKPTASSCGRGIKVIGKKDQVKKKQGYLVQQYVASPHLLRGYKYDLRIYIVVTCFEPLKAYMFQDGLVRLATQQYSTNQKCLKKRFIHLTNYSVNKKAENYNKNTNENKAPGEKAGKEGNDNNNEQEQMESKWSLNQLKAEYKKLGIKFDEIHTKIKDLCLKTLMSVEPSIATAMRITKFKGQAFEIYGFDVLLDSNLKPWLLEVNVAPSLSSSSPYDKQVKSMLLSDVLHLVGFHIFDRKKIDEEKKQMQRKMTKKNNEAPKVAQTQSQGVQKLNMARKIYGENQGIADTTPIKQPKRNAVTSPNHRHGDDPESYIMGSGQKQLEQLHNKSSAKASYPSFIDGFETLYEDEMEVLAQFEEEQSRRQQTKLERIFPTRETIDTHGPHFESQRRVNQILWQYIRQKQPISYLKHYFKQHPSI